MASKRIETDSMEYRLFMDFLRLRQQYYEAENGDEWFDEMARAGEQIMAAYHETALAKLTQNLVLSHFEDVQMRWEARCKEEKEKAA